jgi:hypothetical protein
VTSSTAKNLEAISKAIDQHNEGCPGKLVEIRMNPFEVERLDWDEFQGIPIVADDKIGTGRFQLVCERDIPSHIAAEETAKESVPVGA